MLGEDTRRHPSAGAGTAPRGRRAPGSRGFGWRGSQGRALPSGLGRKKPPGPSGKWGFTGGARSPGSGA